MNHGGPNLSLAFVGVLGFTVKGGAGGGGEMGPVGGQAVRQDFNPLCVLRWPMRTGADAAQFVGLNDFLAANTDSLSLSDIQTILDYLVAGIVYRAGGGADEPFTLEVSEVQR